MMVAPSEGVGASVAWSVDGDGPGAGVVITMSVQVTEDGITPPAGVVAEQYTCCPLPGRIPQVPSVMLNDPVPMPLQMSLSSQALDVASPAVVVIHWRLPEHAIASPAWLPITHEAQTPAEVCASATGGLSSQLSSDSSHLDSTSPRASITDACANKTAAANTALRL